MNWLIVKTVGTRIAAAFASLPTSVKLALLVAAAMYGIHEYTARSVTHELTAKFERELKEQKDVYENKLEVAADAHQAALDFQSLSEKHMLAELQAKLDASKAEAAHLRTIIAKAEKYVTPKADANCTITTGFVWMHDRPLSAAAPLGVPPSEPRDVDAPTGVKASDVARTVADNYTECEARGRIIELWQNWYPEAKRIHEEANAIILRATAK